MQKKLSGLILIMLLPLLLPVWASALDITPINSLIENAKELDGKEVTVQGEAIGEPLARGEYCWVNINDGTNAIGVWMTAEDAKSITHYGSYKIKGDTLQVTGTFRRACAEHGGESDIHCKALSITQTGNVTHYPLAWGKLLVAIILLLLLVMLGLYVYLTKLRK